MLILSLSLRRGRGLGDCCKELESVIILTEPRVGAGKAGGGGREGGGGVAHSGKRGVIHLIHALAYISTIIYVVYTLNKIVTPYSIVVYIIFFIVTG